MSLCLKDDEFTVAKYFNLLPVTLHGWGFKVLELFEFNLNAKL